MLKIGTHDKNELRFELLEAICSLNSTEYARFQGRNKMASLQWN
jgi:hypothetical protein